jgi:hypothetical protein
MDWLILKLEPELLWKAVWPLFFGSLLAWGLHNLDLRRRRKEPEMSAGVPTTPFDRLFGIAEGLLRPSAPPPPARGSQVAKRAEQRTAALKRVLRNGEQRLSSSPVAGGLVVLLLVVLLVLFALLP